MWKCANEILLISVLGDFEIECFRMSKVQSQNPAISNLKIILGMQQKEAKKDWKRLLNYQWIVRNIPYFLFLSVLAVVYIYNGHYSDNTVKDINRTSRELKELQYEYKSLKSEVLFRSKQSELAKMVAALGLKELAVPPMVLIDSTGTAGSH
jgi:hypothetical protein